jgi:DNA-binding XRE family transcriptional regulator
MIEQYLLFMMRGIAGFLKFSGFTMNLALLNILIASAAFGFNYFRLIVMKYSEFGKIVSTARKAQGLTQLELQDLCGVSASVIYKIESGRDDLSLCNFVAVMDTLGIGVHCKSPLGVEIQLNG